MLSQEARYLVAQTKPNAECYAHDFLTGPHFKYEVFYPRVKTQVSHAGRRRVQLRPFLPRYLFVRHDPHVSIPVLRHAPGVAALMVSGDGVATVRQGVIDQIRAREVNGFIELELLPDARRFAHGEKLKLNYDVGVTLDAVFQHRIGERRALVFMNWLGRQVAIKVEVKQLERA